MKNNQAWQSILQSGSILEEINERGFYDIDSDEIRPFREPRLACKIDFRQQIPGPLRDEKLSILAIQNGRYRIARTNPFLDVPQQLGDSTSTTNNFKLPPHIQALSLNGLSSEAKALDAALLSGMLDFVFDDTVQLVIRGFERSKNFTFRLRNSVTGVEPVRYEVEGVSLEVDGGYEGVNGIYLIEAKNQVNDNISLRQLLYPQLHYRAKFAALKPVYSYLMLYDSTTDHFHFSEFQVRRDGSLTDEYDFVFKPLKSCRLESVPAIRRDYWQELHAVVVDASLHDENKPFPQADSFAKVFAAFMRLVAESSTTKEELFSHYAISPRQHDYYANVLCWLKLASCNASDGRLTATSRARTIGEIPANRDKLHEIAKLAMANDTFNRCLRQNTLQMSTTDRHRYRLSSAITVERRLQTVKSWLRYFSELFGDVTN